MSINDNLPASASMPEDSNDASPLQLQENAIEEGHDEDAPSTSPQPISVSESDQPALSESTTSSTEAVDQLANTQEQPDTPETQSVEAINSSANTEEQASIAPQNSEIIDAPTDEQAQTTPSATPDPDPIDQSNEILTSETADQPDKILTPETVDLPDEILTPETVDLPDEILTPETADNSDAILTSEINDQPGAILNSETVDQSNNTQNSEITPDEIQEQPATTETQNSETTHQSDDTREQPPLHKKRQRDRKAPVLPSAKIATARLLKPEISRRHTISLQGRRLALRNVRHSRTQYERSKTFRTAIITLLILIIGGLLMPFIVTLSYGLRVYSTYQTAYTHITDGVQHFLDVKTTLLPANNASNKKSSTSTTSTLFDAHRLAKADADLVAASNDFQELQKLVTNTDFLQVVNQYIPQADPYFRTTSAACNIAIDFAHIGQVLIAAGKTLSPRMSGGSLLGEASTPLFIPSDLSLLESTVTKIQPFISDIQTQTRFLSLDILPLSTKQRSQIQQYLNLLPQLQGYLNLGQGLINPLSWILGIGQPRTFLVETMDSAELRATGGFDGQYGELHINGARLAPFTLTNVALLEYTDNSPSYGQEAPQPYRSWWPFPNWGLRDANLSADFPTSANFIINRYQYETNRSVDGAIIFTPTLIKHVLQSIGSVSISVPHIKETITAQNLEDKIHYYQLDNTGILHEKLYAHNNDEQQARKVFTSLLAHVIMDRVRKASISELVQIGHQVLRDLRTRDLQAYFTDPQAEALLQNYGYDGSMDHSTTHDAFYLVQANVSVSKASQYVQTTMQDTVKLDASGGATHSLQLHFVYNQLATVYGYDTYRDYLRLYVPDNATLLSGDGIDQGPATAICGGPLQACPATNVYPNNALVCPPGKYDGGTSDVMNFDPYSTQDHPLDQLGPPTNLQSDAPGRAMFAGYAIIPKDCSLTVNLSWYVPRQAQATTPYSLLVQRQAGVGPILKLNIQTNEHVCTSPAQLTYQSTLANDMLFSLGATRNKQTGTSKCVLQQQEPLKKGP